MKKLLLISKASLILFSAMVLSLSAQAQDIQTSIHKQQYRPSISGQLLAFHDLREDLSIEENMDIVDILLFIEESVEKGTLKGNGTAATSNVRLNALVQKIEAVDDALSKDTSFEAACQQLLDAYRLTDGLNQPADLVQGPGSQELAQRINYFSGEIVGCD